MPRPHRSNHRRSESKKRPQATTHFDILLLVFLLDNPACYCKQGAFAFRLPPTSRAEPEASSSGLWGSVSGRVRRFLTALVFSWTSANFCASATWTAQLISKGMYSN